MDEKLEKAIKILELADQDYTSPQEVAEIIVILIQAIDSNKDLTEGEIASIRETIKEVSGRINVRIDELRDTVATDRKSVETEIKNIRLKPGPKGDKGDKGDDGETPDIDEVAEKAAKKVPVPNLEVLKQEILELIPKIDEKRLDDIERIAKANAHAMPVTTTNFYKDGTLIGRAKNINFVEGPNTDLSVAINGDTVHVIISSTGDGSSNQDTQQVTATDAGGGNVNIDLTQLTHTFTSIQNVWRNGQLLDKSRWSVVGTNMTVTGAITTNSFQIQYGY